VNRLLAFYRGNAADSQGRYLREILQHDDQWLESTHNFIQWLFPNRAPSQVTPEAPVITDDVQAAFLREPGLRDQLYESLARMLVFYGLTRAGDAIVKGGNWERRKANWFLTDTHNNLRITRILKCLCALGLADEAQALLQALLVLRASEPDCGIGATAFAFWSDALERETR
jgi:hypothetical protein